MNNTLLWVFIGLNVANVIIQTIKSIATIKCKPMSAAVINAVAYGLYTVVLVYMVSGCLPSLSSSPSPRKLSFPVVSFRHFPFGGTGS